MQNKYEDMRNHLFEQLERLRDADSSEIENELKRAREVSNVSGRLIESAKVEVDFLKAAGDLQESGEMKVVGSGFIPIEPRQPKPLGHDSGESK